MFSKGFLFLCFLLGCCWSTSRCFFNSKKILSHICVSASPRQFEICDSINFDFLNLSLRYDSNYDLYISVSYLRFIISCSSLRVLYSAICFGSVNVLRLPHFSLRQTLNFGVKSVSRLNFSTRCHNSTEIRASTRIVFNVSFVFGCKSAHRISYNWQDGGHGGLVTGINEYNLAWPPSRIYVSLYICSISMASRSSPVEEFNKLALGNIVRNQIKLLLHWVSYKNV